MKSTIIGIAVLLTAACASAQNLYVNKNFVTIVPPSSIGVYTPGLTATSTVATASNTTGVAVNTYPGTAALLLSVNCGDANTAGIVTWTAYSTTNIGTAAAYTNGAFAVSSNQPTFAISFTNCATNCALPFIPNRELGWINGVFSAAVVTNGSVSEVLITTAK